MSPSRMCIFVLFALAPSCHADRPAEEAIITVKKHGHIVDKAKADPPPTQQKDVDEFLKYKEELPAWLRAASSPEEATEFLTEVLHEGQVLKDNIKEEEDVGGSMANELQTALDEMRGLGFTQPTTQTKVDEFLQEKELLDETVAAAISEGEGLINRIETDEGGMMHEELQKAVDELKSMQPPSPSPLHPWVAKLVPKFIKRR
eukprot:gnl/TRDRNA2_/TRDRNA2_196143_c0_seq1.p1 gnl/TRDRNA2_/TRDRNA2_196143_c0~~gnl/TRDRNA2_/TRDRNA2_196143_c0_seq1.p1  ORF type:complete len:203 (-),score=37.30 gnl/TRDRNA2_/TRDRNA2_196143_c0_seq1:129-737(-)